jgi:hypothetical protein
MNPKGTLYPLVELIRTRALVVGGGAAALGLVGAFFNHRAFDRAYLFTYIFILGLALGSLALLMIHRQLGGAWGFLIRRPLEAGAMTLPLMAVLFIPVLIDLERIYPWVDHPPGTESEHSGTLAEPSGSKKAREEGGPVKVTSSEPVSLDPAGKLQQKVDSAEVTFKAGWLNPTWFTVRMAIYFAIWIVLALVLAIGSRRQDETGSTDLAYRLNGLSGVGLLIYGLSVSFALIDWGMSLEPAWYSTLYGVLLIIGQAISTMAFMIIIAAIISRRGEVEGLDKPETFNDLGNLLLAFTMLWGYLSFSQFLIIWAGNLAEEIPWYVRRLHGGWEWMGRFLILFHFAVPFLVLLARPLKRNISALWKIAALVLFAHLIDDYWLIAASPAFDPRDTAGHVIMDPNPGWFTSTFSWLDLVMPVAMGGLWLSAFLWLLKSRPLMIAHDPQLLPALKQASGGH